MLGFLRRASPLVVVVALGCGGVDPESVGTAQSESVVCATGPTVEGLDVSAYQPGTDWSAVRQSGRRFAFIKATEGTSYVNPYFASDWSAAKDNGVLTGAYHFFRPAKDADAQAAHFLSVVGGAAPADLPSVIDLEVSDGLSGATVADQALAFLSAVEQATGRRPIVYTAPGFWSTIGDPSGFDGYPLWIANYGVSCPHVPGDWSTWKFWQYTASQPIPGVEGSDVDHDAFLGSFEELDAFANGNRAWGDLEEVSHQPRPEIDIAHAFASSGLDSTSGRDAMRDRDAALTSCAFGAPRGTTPFAWLLIAAALWVLPRRTGRRITGTRKEHAISGKPEHGTAV